MTDVVAPQQTRRPIPNEDTPAPPVNGLEAARMRNVGARVQPHDLAAEASLLGACLLSPKAIDAAVTVGITADAFYKPSHGHIWTACLALNTAGDPADPVTVADQLHRDGLLEKVGGGPALVHLQAGTPAISNAAKYAGIVADFAQLRRLITTAGEIADLGYSLPDDVAVVVDRAQQLVASVAHQSTASIGEVYADVAKVLAGERGEPPSVGLRSDGRIAMFYRGRLNNVFGESESCKSWLVQAVCVEQLRKGEHVVYLDGEKDASSVFERLLLLGATEADLLERFHYQRREEPFTATHRAWFRSSWSELAPSLVVFDGVTNMMMLEGSNPLDNVQVSAFYSGAPHDAELAGAAGVMVDHIVKNRDARMPGALGGQHKRAGITGASLLMTLKDKPARGHDGRGFLRVDKDAEGWLRSESIEGWGFADVVITSDAGAVSIALEPSSAPTKTPAGVLRRTGYMERVSIYLEGRGPGGATPKEIDDDVTGTAAYVREAVKVLEDEGYVRRVVHNKQQRRVCERPYREAWEREHAEPDDLGDF